ncbi:hypothetical protein [Rhizobium leguminosarum]|jgi:hypothetical protein|nr:hypothetical protein [Rhizobium leguminosarum]MBY2910683.1 hypothetical protein [Rhizobium leguminosarum]MBY2936903.1 hypothetical protein [Rhizobium leguminosarum]MBY2950765.1 hypothetical protein [Rhizobium leguminosarum]MBY2968057.1 hypothetical protein [Rhizobium leguminosarum]MBY2995116.1 hypothetical protein [Rhizobium leguminosarum]
MGRRLAPKWTSLSFGFLSRFIAGVFVSDRSSVSSPITPAAHGSIPD